jgi:hypothetical protein
MKNTWLLAIEANPEKSTVMADIQIILSKKGQSSKNSSDKR